MRLLKRRIQMKSSKETWRIRCVEPHLGSEGHDERLLRDFIQRTAKDPYSLWLCTGDLIDADRPSTRERKAQSMADRKEAWRQDDEMAFAWLDKKIIPKLAPIKDKCLGILDGDHYLEFSSGKTSTEYICEKLKIPYLGRRMAYVGISFHYRENNTYLYNILARHGKGSATTVSGDMAALVRQNAQWIADLYFGAHTHKEHAHPVPILAPNADYSGLRQRIAWYVRVGSFLRGFLPGAEQYAELKEYSPLVCGWGEMELVLAKSNGNNRNLAIVESAGQTRAF